MIYATADALTDFGTRFFPRIARASRQTCRRQGERENGRSGEREPGKAVRTSAFAPLPFSPSSFLPNSGRITALVRYGAAGYIAVAILDGFAALGYRGMLG
jgi:hypothetical protein